MFIFDEEVWLYIGKEVLYMALKIAKDPNILKMQSYLYKRDRGELFLLYELMDVGNLKHYVSKFGTLKE